MQDFVGKQIDRYRITERLGIGGMAVVYKAYDTRLERDVAIKVIRSEEIPQSQHVRLLKRFEQEARAQARFSHSHIVPAYDYGEFERTPYLVLAYMPGGTLKERIRGMTPVIEALNIVMPIADAIAYAHSKGVLHRDVKPSNIIFSQDDIPLLTDFGIAKVLETTDATLTGTGLGVGTPEYMAPEQWQGQANEASDQYALGVVLYELLTGEKPFTAETPLAVALKVMHDPIKRPRDLNSAIPHEVENLLYKALARRSQDRYRDMKAFTKALEEQIEKETPEIALLTTATRSAPPTPVVDMEPALDFEALTTDHLNTGSVKAARPILTAPTESFAPRVRPKKTKLPIWMYLAVIVAILSIALAAGTKWLARGRNIRPKQGELTIIGAQMAEINNNQLTQNSELKISPTSSITPSKTQISTPVFSATPTFGLTETTPTQMPLIFSNPDYPVIQLSNSGSLKEVARFNDGFTGDLAWMPDGNTLAVSGGNGIFLYFTQDEGKKDFIETGSEIYSIAFSPDGGFLAAGSWDGTIYLFETESNSLLAKLVGQNDEVCCLVFSPDGETLLSGSADGSIFQWDMTGRTLFRTLEGHDRSIIGLAVSPDGKIIASAEVEKTVILWDLESGIVLHRIDAHTSGVTGVGFTMDGTRLITGCEDGTLAIWIVESGERLGKYSMPGFHGVHYLAISPNGSKVLTRVLDRYYLWNARNISLLSAFGESPGGLNAAFSPDGTSIATVGESLHLLDANTGVVIRELDEKTHQKYRGFAISPDGSFMAILGYNTNFMWNLKNRRRELALEGSDINSGELAFSPDGKKLVTTDDDQTLHVWDLEKRLELYKISGNTEYISSLTFSPDSSLLASASGKGSIILWGVNNGELLHTLEGSSGTIRLLDFSPDGKILAAHEYPEEYFYAWDVESGLLLATTKVSTIGRPIDRITLMADRLLFALGESGSLVIWDIENNQVERRFYWIADEVMSMALSQDGDIVASAGSDRIIRLWKPGSWESNSLPGDYSKHIYEMAFSPDGKLLAAADRWNSIQLWNAISGEQLDALIGKNDDFFLFTPDGRMIICVNRLGTFSIWAVDEG